MLSAFDYFDRGSPRANHISSRLEKIDEADWYELCRHKDDGSLWRIDKEDKYQQSYILQVQPGMDWKNYDPTPEMKALLLATRGESEVGCCIVAGCTGKQLNELAFCMEHAFERDIRR